MLSTISQTIILVALFIGMAVGLITLVVYLFSGANASIKKEYDDAQTKGKLYSELKIDSITQDLNQKEEVYHLKGVVNGINYDIQVLKSEYEKKKRYYENANNDSEH
ncbi:hypothetical protein [Proteus mirabilis]|uniref:hypothetical protein n=1 Tax=Proteus mirabilis TaxID=584 RepID=UPI0034D63063